MQSRSVPQLRQGHLVRLRHARRRCPRERADGGAVHLPLTGLRRGHRRRLLAAAVAAPVLAVLLLSAAGGWSPATPVLWTAVVVVTAGFGAAVLATYVPLAGQPARAAFGCAPCAAGSALTVVGAAILLASGPQQVSMALAALSLVVYGLVQRRTSSGAACPSAPPASSGAGTA